jgi:hypothetical protein
MKEPTIPENIVLYLEELFPPQDFTTKTSHRDMDFHNGQRSVVRFVKRKYYEQNENILNKPIE